MFFVIVKKICCFFVIAKKIAVFVVAKINCCFFVIAKKLLQPSRMDHHRMSCSDDMCYFTPGAGSG
jgi:hypothetical protein